MNAMHSSQGLSAYQQVNRFTVVEGASAHQLIEMLLKGALDKIAKAKGLMAHKDIAGKGEAISKSIAIIDELMASLNMEAGGELAQNLLALYEYVKHILLQANLNNDQDKLDEAGRLLGNIYQAWTEIPASDRR